MESAIEKYIKDTLEDSPDKTAKFLINAWNSSYFDSNEKYEVILKYFTKNLSKYPDNVVKEILALKYPTNSVKNDTIKKILRTFKQKLQTEKTSDTLEICTSIIFNESYKEFFKVELNTYCELIGSILDAFYLLEFDKFEILDDIIRELHYFARTKNFPQTFRKYVLLPLHRLSTSGKYVRVNDMWNLIKSIYFSQSYNEENSNDTMELFNEDVTNEQMEVLIESFIISFKLESDQIIKLLNRFIEDVLSRHDSNHDTYLSLVKILYSLLKKHDIEVTAIRKLESSFDKLSQEVLSRLVNSVDDMKLCEYFKVLSTVILYDPFSFVENNLIYKLLVECMMKEKLEGDMKDYETLLTSVIKIFGKDINQFLRKLIFAIDEKLENFVIPKKRKRKITNESDTSTKKKQKLSDGSSITSDNCYITNIWTNAIKSTLDEIFADLNVNQTVKLWKFLNDSLKNVIEKLPESINENALFKIDFISSLICQLVTSNRVHEHLIYKSSEISSAINDFNVVQHNFYETIIKIEYNNRIMNAFLKMSYDYENFIMMYYYHFNEEEKNDIDSIFIADKSRIKSSEWKIIQQRIKNFGKIEEKSYSNLLMIQHLIKNKLFKVANNEENKEFFQKLFMDSDQINMLLERKDVRLHIFNLLNDEITVENLLGDLFSKINDDRDKIIAIFDLAKNNSKMLEILLNLLLEKYHKNETIEIVKQLPISFLSHESKTMLIEKLLLKKEVTANDENYLDLIIIFSKIFKSDGYKTFFKNFTMDILLQNFSDVEKFKKIYDFVIRTSLKKMTIDVLKNLEWILQKSNSIELIQILAKCLIDLHLTPTNECSIESLNKLKMELICYFSMNLNEKNIVDNQKLFCVFSRLCSQNMQILNDKTKEHHLDLFNKLLKSLTKSQASEDIIEVFMLTLKDAKKFNLNDELKSGIVKTLTKHLNSTIQESILGEKIGSIERERELITALSSFKSNCREECSQFLYTLISGKDNVSDKQLIYSYKIYEILFEICEKNDRKENLLVKNYMKYCIDYVIAKGKISEVELLCAIYSSHIAMMKCFKEKLDFTIIDDLFCFHIDQCNRLILESTEDFCKFFEIVGQFLFVLGNYHQNYFKSRIPQYFKAYNKFLDAIYFFKADNEQEFSVKESSMLLRLTLQLENIVKMLMKLHSNSFSIITPNIVSSIVNVLIKNPKMLSIGDKFKVNIKNICFQLLSTVDDKTRKYIYATVDESTKDVYDSLFREIKRK